MPRPSYLVIGHVTQDAVASGFRLGGTATYAGVTAARLGWSVRVLTAGNAEARGSLTELLPEAEFSWVESPESTRFHNRYHGEIREQHLLSLAAPLIADALPVDWLESEVAHLGPVAQEVDQHLMTAFPPLTTVGVTPQGWLRLWDQSGRVETAEWGPATAQLSSLSALVLSREDVGGSDIRLDHYREHSRLMVVTRGFRGCTIYAGGQVIHLETRSAVEMDPTGAGDVFAAAFFIRLHETGDPVQAARFANVAGSFSVEGPGTDAIPTRDQIESWLRGNPSSNGRR